MDHFCYLCFVFVLFSCVFIAVLWSPCGKGLSSWLSCMSGSKETLIRKELKRIQFSCSRCEVNRKVLMECQDVVLSRIGYLRRIKELCEAGYNLVYFDVRQYKSRCVEVLAGFQRWHQNAFLKR